MKTILPTILFCIFLFQLSYAENQTSEEANVISNVLPVLKAFIGATPNEIISNSSLDVRVNRLSESLFDDPGKRIEYDSRFVNFDFIYKDKKYGFRINNCGQYAVTLQENHTSNIVIAPHFELVDINDAMNLLKKIEIILTKAGWVKSTKKEKNLYSLSEFQNLNSYEHLARELKNYAEFPQFRVIVGEWSSNDSRIILDITRLPDVPYNEIFDINEHNIRNLVNLEIYTHKYDY